MNFTYWSNQKLVVESKKWPRKNSFLGPFWEDYSSSPRVRAGFNSPCSGRVYYPCSSRIDVFLVLQDHFLSFGQGQRLFLQNLRYRHLDFPESFWSWDIISLMETVGINQLLYLLNSGTYLILEMSFVSVTKKIEPRITVWFTQFLLSDLKLKYNYTIKVVF